MTYEVNDDKARLFAGGRIRDRRINLGMTQQTLATAIGVSPQQLQKYEIGENNIAWTRMLRIANALDCEIGAFADDKEAEKTAFPPPSMRSFTSFVARSAGRQLFLMLRTKTDVELRRVQKLVQAHFGNGNDKDRDHDDSPHEN